MQPSDSKPQNVGPDGKVPHDIKRKISPIMHRWRVGPFTIKEPLSALSHFAGAVVALGAFLSLFAFPQGNATNAQLAAFAVYSLSMFAVFMASTLCHGVPASMKWQHFFNRLDHAMIFTFIAGSYFPVFLVGTPPNVGIPIVIAVSLIGVVGILLEFFGPRKTRKWGTLAFVAMGWVGVTGFSSLLENLPGRSPWLIAAGGVIYTLGALIFVFKRPDPFPRVFGYHEIFHIFVLGGCALHFWAIWFELLPTLR